MRSTPAGPQPDLRAVARPPARTRCARAPLSPNLSVSVFCGLVVIVLVGWGEGFSGEARGLGESPHASSRFGLPIAGYLWLSC